MRRTRTRSSGVRATLLPPSCGSIRHRQSRDDPPAIALCFQPGQVAQSLFANPIIRKPANPIPEWPEAVTSVGDYAEWREDKAHLGWYFSFSTCGPFDRVKEHLLTNGSHLVD